ncbi:thiamine phosphate synthase [Nocardioidaceae bacterium]|nr:thiamine phosphate synthase [Nocardioidaceae bacterium]
MSTSTPARPRFAPGPYLIADTGVCAARGPIDVVRAALVAGVTAVQVRAKHEPSSRVRDLVCEAAEVCRGRALLIVNDRVDVFLTVREQGAEVAGVHVGQDDLDPVVVRDVVGSHAIVGWSASTAAELAAAAALPPGTLDYLGVGTIRATATKSDAPAALGVAGFAEVCRATSLPCVAIGGIRAADLPGIRAAGGAGAAVVSAVCASEDPRAVCECLVREWDRG